jgi:hypothetical protein
MHMVKFKVSARSDTIFVRGLGHAGSHLRGLAAGSESGARATRAGACIGAEAKLKQGASTATPLNNEAGEGRWPFCESDTPWVGRS